MTSQIRTTTEDAHRLMLADIERERADALRTAKTEAEAAIAKLQRLLETIQADAVPSSVFDLPDTRRLAQAISTAEASHRSAQHVRGWLGMINVLASDD